MSSSFSYFFLRVFPISSILAAAVSACGGGTIDNGTPGLGSGAGSSVTPGTDGQTTSGNGGSASPGSGGSVAVPDSGTSNGSGGARRDAGLDAAPRADSGARADGATTTTSGCGTSVTMNANPLGCGFAWGTEGNSGNRSSYLDFISAWVGSEANGGLGGSCTGCTLAKQLASTSATVGYYAYFIGFQARAAGFGDCNTDTDGHTLCTDGAQWIRSNRANLIAMYANYAKLTYQASPNKGVVWLLEGEFIQYTNKTQTNALTNAELGQLASDIICAIKSNEPNAAVAIDHSSWIRNPQLTSYFQAMPLSITDFVWTTGMGNVAGGYLNTGDSFNRSDGTYAYLHMLTGKNILVDTSFGVSAQGDTWSTADAATLKRRRRSEAVHVGRRIARVVVDERVAVLLVFDAAAKREAAAVVGIAAGGGGDRVFAAVLDAALRRHGHAQVFAKIGSFHWVLV
jgi:hypothetical protein